MSPNCIVMPDQQGADDKKSTKSVVNRKQKQMLNQEYIPEEEYDHYKDRMAERGIDISSKDKKDATTLPQSKRKEVKGDTVYQAKLKKKHGGKIPSALDLVKADIIKKHGKGAIMDVKKKSKKKANEELDLTKVAEAFGGYVIENIKDPKFSDPEAEKKFQDSPEAKRLKKTVSLSRNPKTARKTAKSLRSGFDTVELENPQDTTKQTRLDQEAKKRAQSGKNQSLKAFSNEPLDDVKTPDEVRDPKTGETLTKGGESQAEVEKRRAQVKRDAYSNPKTARKGERVVDQDQFSTRTGIIGRGGVEVTSGKGDGRKAGRTPEERKTGKVSYKDFVANQEVTKDKVTQSDVDAKDSGETVTYTTPDKRKKRSDAGKPRVKKEPEVKKPDVTGDTEAKGSGETVDYGEPDQETVTQSQTNKGGQTKFKDQRVTTGAGDGRKGQRTFKDFSKKIITKSQTDKGGQKGTVTYNTSPNVNINSPVETPPVETEKPEKGKPTSPTSQDYNTYKQGEIGDANAYKDFNKFIDDAKKGSQAERERANRQLAGIQDPEADAMRDKAEKDPKIKELDMTKRFSRAVDVVDPSKPRAKASFKTPEGRVSMLTALGSFAAKQAAPSLAGAEAGALFSRKDYRGAAAAAGQALGGPLGFVAGLYSMNRMLRGKGKVDTKNMQNAVRSAQQMQLGIPGMNMNQILPQTQTQPAMGGGDRGEMELAALGAYTLPKAGEKLRNLKLPPVRGGRAGMASARGGGGL